MVAVRKIAPQSPAENRERHDAAVLRTFEAFRGFSDDELLRLVRASHHDSLSAPWPLIYQQTPSDACYILLSGEASVYIGREHIAALGPGEVIGESALGQRGLRSATVTTNGPTEVLRIERDDLARLLDEIPPMREVIAATVLRHAPVEPGPRPAAQHAQRTKLNASVPEDLATRFERSAAIAGMTVAAALEDALTQWLQGRNDGEPKTRPVKTGITPVKSD